MSRPPIHRDAASPRAIGEASGQSLYFGPRFADLVALSENLAQQTYGIEVPDKDRGLARTAIEVSSLISHILGEYQNHFANESYLATATTAASLVAHADRLAYTPDHGVAATGLAVFDVKDGLDGVVPAHFALQSEPKGDLKAQTYETLEETRVAADWNDLRDVSETLPTVISFNATGLVSLTLTGPHGLDRADIVILQGNGKSAVCQVADPLEGSALQLRRMSDGPESTGTGVWPPFNPASPYVILCQPQTRTRSFGWNADPVSFPAAEVASTDLYLPPTSDGEKRFGYQISGLSDGSYVAGHSLILAEVIDPLPPQAPLAIVQGNRARSFLVSAFREAMISFRFGTRIAVPQPPEPPEGFPTSQNVDQAHSGRASLLDLTRPDGSPQTWAQLPVDATIHADWGQILQIAPHMSNSAAMAVTVTTQTDLTGMRTGRQVIVERRSDGLATAARITRIFAPDSAAGAWSFLLTFDEGAAASSFPLGDMSVRANVAPVSHGETKSEIIGSSDGVTPHQDFKLKKAPVTQLTTANGAETALEVRVNGVLWQLVEDFHGATPEDRLVRSRVDADQSLSVAFGGEGRGAIPPGGRRNLTVEYRVGLGQSGNTGAGRLTRITKSSPILNAVTNLTPLGGGTDPADKADIRRQAPQPIKTFDRAVSVQDHADLALLFQGVARSSARWLNRGVIELIASDSDGNPPANPSVLRAFLDARRDTSVPLIILDPQPVDIMLKLRVERDAAWLADALRQDVTRALLEGSKEAPGLFSFAGRRFSQPQSLSGLYAFVKNLDGVTGADALRYVIPPATGVADILHATDRQWLRLLPSNLDIRIAEPSQLIPQAAEATL